MITFLQIVHIIVCASLIGLVLIQSGKGQGLAGAFGSFAGGTAQNLFGARTGDVLTKITGYLTITFFVLALLLAYLQMKASKSVMENFQKPMAVSEVPTEKANEISNKLTELTNKLISSEEKTEKKDTPVNESANLKEEGLKPELITEVTETTTTNTEKTTTKPTVEPATASN